MDAWLVAQGLYLEKFLEKHRIVLAIIIISYDLSYINKNDISVQIENTSSSLRIFSEMISE